MKENLRTSREALQKYWQQGVSGRQLLEKHTEVIDTYLRQCFSALPQGRDQLALIALGGYGRREIFPFSDIDLMILHHPKTPTKLVEQGAESIFYPLWDAGLEVGHAVRTPKDCLADCKRDFFLQVSLLDSRCVVGEETLYTELIQSFRKKFIDGHRHEFLRELTEGRINRHRRYGLHTFQLEPHIKEGRGGFRDIHAMLWTSFAVFGLQGIPAMEEAGLLTARERGNFEEAFDHLTKIRNRLHYLSGRKNDQLFFEHQEEIAAALGYRDNKGKLGVESFMQEVHGSLQTVAITSDLFFCHVEDKVGKNRHSDQSRELEPGINVRNEWIVADPARIVEKPFLMMRIFVQAATTGLPIHFRTRQLITANLDRIDDKLRKSRAMTKSFLEALQSTSDPLTTLTTMLETGLLTSFLPEFKEIESLAQHDVYHIYTVDRHLIQTVTELKYITEEQKNLFDSLPTPHILYLAALLHDIGKGQGVNHELSGADITEGIAQRLGLPEDEKQDLVFLVKNHLYLSHLAQRRDLEDNQFINQFAQQVEKPARLTMLYLLSIADARATGPSAWSSWKGALLQELYLKTIHVLEHTDHSEPNRAQAAQWMREKVGSQLEQSTTVNLDDIPDDYLISYSPQEVLEHLQLRNRLHKQHLILVPRDFGDYWALVIVSHDRTGLLTKICGTLALHNLDVLAANINTWLDGTVVDLISVRPVFKSDFQSQNWSALERDMNRASGNKLGISHRLAAKKQPVRPLGAKRQDLTTQVKIDNTTSRMYTIIEVFADDRPSLLYNITRTMADFDINISRAMISTRQGQLIDVFYVLDSEGGKLTENEFQEEVKQALLHAATNSQ
ncbi:MAG: [protein-PII] uridylyltransferase [Proteobacteria bacterium]|nr:[protein-PII] uridylyltransferase [Pseudomonadota bacterium]MBU1685969.1 [protein-PII] uridylyltransferase [Pseudomonadota bacterium]